MIRLRSSPERICVPKGFSFASVAAGIKASGKTDLALVSAQKGSNAAALFTTNRVVAAPVMVGRKYLLAGGGRVRAVIVNSGNANCATGQQGNRACEKVCDEIGRLLSVPADEVFPSSTGIIGVQLPVEKIISRAPQLISALDTTKQAAAKFARAILTTDTREKIASARFKSGSKQVTLLGIAKGAGMIHPQLATMLVYLFTDIGAKSRELQTQLRDACYDSLNCISIDGDTSTNDTVLLMASGASGAQLIGRRERNFRKHWPRYANRWRSRSSAMERASSTSYVCTLNKRAAGKRHYWRRVRSHILCWLKPRGREPTRIGAAFWRR